MDNTIKRLHRTRSDVVVGVDYQLNSDKRHYLIHLLLFKYD